MGGCEVSILDLEFPRFGWVLSEVHPRFFQGSSTSDSFDKEECCFSLGAYIEGTA